MGSSPFNKGGGVHTRVSMKLHTNSGSFQYQFEGILFSRLKFSSVVLVLKKVGEKTLAKSNHAVNLFSIISKILKKVVILMLVGHH